MRRALAALASLLLASSARAQEVDAVPADASMRWLANASDPGVDGAWMLDGFDDGAWAAGRYGVGYETGTARGARALVATPVPGGALSVYTRAAFDVPAGVTVSTVHFAADWDDGVVAWLNGVEIWRSPEMPAGPPAWNTDAALHESSNAGRPMLLPYVDVGAVALAALRPSGNVLAVGVWNSGGATSSDLVLVPRLVLNKQVAIARGPYLQSVGPDRATVRWRTDLPAPTTLWHGADPGTLDVSLGDATPKTEHEVTLTGLAPGARRYYAVGGAAPLAGGDEEHRLETPAPHGARLPFRAWVLGDSGTKDASQARVRDAFLARDPRPTDLLLMLGDNAYDDGEDSEYQEAVFDAYADTLRSTPLWPTLGNHDGRSADSPTESGVYYDAFTLPRGGECGGVASGTEAWYSFDWQNVHFVCLDSFDSSRLAADAMAQWLLTDLASTTQEWLVAFWHHPPYSKGSHDSDTEVELVEMRENLVPLLEDAGVDLVLCGHSHSYERSWLIDGHHGDSATFNPSHLVDGGDGRVSGDGPYRKPASGLAPHAGAVYVVAGSSGQTDTGPFDHPAMYLSIPRLGSLSLTFHRETCDVAFVSDTGALIDEFRIVKPPPQPAAESCANGQDDDGDALADCADPDCASADEDGDARLDCSADCAPTDPHAWSLPSEIARLEARRAGAADALLSWLAPAAGGTAFLADVASGRLSELRADRGFARAACVARSERDRGWSDPRPAGSSGDGWWYLVRARHGCGAGPWGAGIAGACD